MNVDECKIPCEMLFSCNFKVKSKPLRLKIKLRWKSVSDTRLPFPRYKTLSSWFRKASIDRSMKLDSNGTAAKKGNLSLHLKRAFRITLLERSYHAEPRHGAIGWSAPFLEAPCPLLHDKCLSTVRRTERGIREMRKRAPHTGTAPTIDMCSNHYHNCL